MECRIFKPTKYTISNEQSFAVYDVSPTCFGLYIDIITEAAPNGIQIQQILLNMCMCRVKYNIINIMNIIFTFLTSFPIVSH